LNLDDTTVYFHYKPRRPVPTCNCTAARTFARSERRERKAMYKIVRLVVFGGLVTLAACGTSPQPRTTGGAAAGAAAGAGIGAIAGPPGMALGAAVGAGAGALTGAVTKPSQLNLGTPPWANPETRVPGVSNPTPSSDGTSSGGAGTQ
jgi:hypothetical protein